MLGGLAKPAEAALPTEQYLQVINGGVAIGAIGWSLPGSFGVAANDPGHSQVGSIVTLTGGFVGSWNSFLLITNGLIWWWWWWLWWWWLLRLSFFPAFDVLASSFLFAASNGAASSCSCSAFSFFNSNTFYFLFTLHLH